MTISEINPGRREAAQEDVQRLSESIAEVGMMNPITVTGDHILIAGLHRLEAAKKLGWTEVECRISDMDALHTELAEIDENVIRTGLSDLELSELLARWRYFMSYWNNRRICSANGGLPPALKRQIFYDSVALAA